MSSLSDLSHYLNAISRYRLVTVCTLIVGILLTVWTVKELPDIYSSTTLIMIEPQDVPESYVRATVTDRLEKRLQAMNQEVLSRTRLEAIINDFGLYPELRGVDMPMEQIVALMRRRVVLQIFAANNAFRITYEGDEPRTTQRVTARLADLYIDENLRMREAHASGTTEFMESELEKARRQLEEQETRVQAFKREHLGELPEQQGTNMQLLEGHQAQLRTLSTSLARAQERKLLLEKQASEVRAANLTSQHADGQTVLASPGARLPQLEAQLLELRGRYTDAHPDVMQLRSLIERLRGELAPESEGTRLDPTLPAELARALVEAQLEVSRLREDEARAKQLIEVYQQRVENAFVRVQQMETLTRDYEVTRRKYQNLLDKKLEAQLSQSLEQRQKAERFRVIDPASFPQSPTRPNRQLLVAAGAGLSISLALFLPILLWRLDSSFQLAEELTAFGLPILAVIPQIPTRDVFQRRRQYRFRVLTLTLFTLVVGLGSASFYAKYLF